MFISIVGVVTTPPQLLNLSTRIPINSARNSYRDEFNIMELNAKIRENKGTKAARKLRAEKQIPASFYGPGAKSILLSLNKKEFDTIFKQAGETTLVTVKIDGKDGFTEKVMIYDMERDPVTDQITHVDLYKAPLDKKIEVEVPFEFVGESSAVKDKHGTALFNLKELPVLSLPESIPHSIKVDISVIKDFETYISVGDIKLPEGVEPAIDADLVVVSVAEPRTDRELEELDEEVSGDVSEVEGVEKEDEESDSEESSSDEGKEEHKEE